jgi:tetratricopeptide (TPR) repeat protein
MKNRKILAVMILFISLSLSSIWTAWSESIPQIYQQSYEEEAKGNYQEAILVLMQANRAGDNSYLYHLRLGWLQYLVTKYTDSVNSYRKAVILNKDSIEAKLGLMLPLMAQGKWSDAEKVAKEILSLDPLSYLANSRLAYIYYNLKQYKDAEASYRKVLLQYPGDIEMQAGLAWSLLKQDKKEAAEKAFGEILRYVPNHVSGNAGMKIVKGK